MEEGQPNCLSSSSGGGAAPLSFSFPTVQVGNRIIDPSMITVPKADPNPAPAPLPPPRSDGRGGAPSSGAQRGGRGGQFSRQPNSNNSNSRFTQQPPKLTLSTLPVSTTTQSNGSNVLFFSSVMKAGGVVAATESEAQQQLVRSGAIRATASNYGRKLAKLRRFDQAEKRDKGTMRVGVEEQTNADADAAAASISTSMFLDTLDDMVEFEGEHPVDGYWKEGEEEEEEVGYDSGVAEPVLDSQGDCDSIARKRHRDDDDDDDDDDRGHMAKVRDVAEAAVEHRENALPSDTEAQVTSGTIQLLAPSRTKKRGALSLLDRFE